MKKMQSVRQKRVAREIKQAVCDVLMRDSGDGYIITVTDVEVSADLQVAHVFISSSSDKDTVLEWLNKKNMRTEVASRLALKFAPNIIFLFDNTINYAENIENILKNIPKYI